MPVAALVATQLTDHSARAYSIYLGPNDVILSVPFNSIRIVEAGPGGVSSMSFAVLDPTSSINFPDEAEVQAWDWSGPTLMFRGNVDEVSYQPWAANGRTINVQCVGVESWLDKFKVYPAVTKPATYNTNLMISELASTFSPLRAATDTARDGSFDMPIGALSQTTDGSPVASLQTDVELDGTTLREAIRQLIAASANNDTSIPVAAYVTLDFFLGVRVYPERYDAAGAVCAPDDWSTLIVNHTAGTNASGDITHTIEPGVVRRVHVRGLNAAGSGSFDDGTGLRGREEIVDSETSDTEAKAAQVAANYFAAQAAEIRGTVTIANWSPGTGYHAGGLLNMTDAQVGISGMLYRIMEITKTFEKDGKQNWVVNYGGLRPTAMRQLRRLTRDVLS